jgi:hypothetical protein
MLREFIRPAVIHFFTFISFLLLVALRTGAFGAEPTKPSCDDVQRRVHRHRPAMLGQVWQELGIKGELELLGERQNPTNEFAEKAILQVSREAGPLPSMRNEYILLVISQASYGPYQYLFSTRTAGKCTYIGHINASDKHGRPEYRILRRATAGIWFILNRVGYGSGYRRDISEWYSVDTKTVRAVLHYPRLGYESVGTAFEFVTSSDYKTGSGNERIGLNVYAQYTGMLPSSDVASLVDLFSTTREIAFVWRTGERRFILSQPAEFSTRYLDWLAGEWTDNGFVHYHIDELMKIAKNGTPEQKSWLGQFLQSVNEPQAEALRAALAAK